MLNSYNVRVKLFNLKKYCLRYIIKKYKRNKVKKIVIYIISKRIFLFKEVLKIFIYSCF